MILLFSLSWLGATLFKKYDVYRKSITLSSAWLHTAYFWRLMCNLNIIYKVCVHDLGIKHISR